MNPAIEKMLSQVFELEGLLLVLDRHGRDVSPYVYDMIQKKVERLNELAPDCTPDMFGVRDTDIIETVTVEHEPVVDEEEDSAQAEQPTDIEEIEVPTEESCNETTEVAADETPMENSEHLKLDEVLQRNISKDLSKAFTLNDRFRYRRELFCNSEVEMCNTINMIETMHSFAEAEEYFYGDLEWDKESPEVMDFMTIIRNHFL